MKQRLQLRNSNTRTVLQTFRQIYRTEGLSALWISYPTTLSTCRGRLHSHCCFRLTFLLLLLLSSYDCSFYGSTVYNL